MGADDRRTILERRARFVVPALALLSGCAGARAQAEGAHGEGVRRGEVAVPAPGDAGASAGEPVPERAAATAAPASLPPLDVPADAEGIARNLYESLARRVPALHRAVDALQADLPEACDLADAACRREWSLRAQRMSELEHDFVGLRPVCPGSSEQAARYAERVEAHVAYGLGRVAAIEAEVEARFASGGGDAGWARLRGEAQPMRPMVCLDCAMW